MAANATFALKPGVWSCGFASSSLLLIRDENPRRRQAENPLNRLSRFSKPALCARRHGRRKQANRERSEKGLGCQSEAFEDGSIGQGRGSARQDPTPRRTIIQPRRTIIHRAL